MKKFILSSILLISSLVGFQSQGAEYRELSPEVLFRYSIGFERRDESSGATVNDLDTSKSYVKLTSTVSTINGAVAPTSPVSRMLIISNMTGSAVIVSHESASASAANRFSLPNGEDLEIAPGAPATFLYDHGQSRWVVGGGGGGASDAIGLDYTPTTSTDWTDPDPVNGQEALDQLAQRVTDDETALSNHIGDASGAHAASAISVSPTAELLANEVQSALEEIQTEVVAAQSDADTAQADIDAHEADATGAHAGSAISVTPSGGLAADDVQEALEELQTENDSQGTAISDAQADATQALADAAEALLATKRDINQVAHGFAVCEIIRHNGTSYVKAQADAEANAEVYGIVTAVADADNFTVTTHGYVDCFSGLTAGTYYFLDPSTAGAYTVTAPTTINQVVKPVFYALSATEGNLGIYRGNVVTGNSDATEITYDPLTDADWPTVPDDVAEALDTAMGAVVSHENAATGAHAATAISVSPAGNLLADDVQEALEELQGDLDNLSSETLTKEIAQPAHSLDVGDWVYFNGTSYVKAQADEDANSEVYGVVSAVADANNFTITTQGHVTGLSGLTAGAAHFLSADTAGAITDTEPSGLSQVSKPVLLADSTTSGYVLIQRGSVNGFGSVTLATEWQTYTPTYTALGSPTNATIEYRRVGDSLELRGTFTTGTVSGSEARISLPTGLTIASSISRNSIVGYGASGNNVTAAQKPLVLINGGNSYVTFGSQSSSNPGLDSITGSDFGSSIEYGFFATGIPIAEWQQSTTVDIFEAGDYGPTSYTPTFTGLSGTGGINCTHARQGKYLEVDCTFTAGSSTGVTVEIGLPTGLTMEDSLPAISYCGEMVMDLASAYSIPVLCGTSLDHFRIARWDSTNSGMDPAQGNIIGTQLVSFKARVPIEGWSTFPFGVAMSKAVYVGVHDSTCAWDTSASGAWNDFGADASCATSEKKNVGSVGTVSLSSTLPQLTLTPAKSTEYEVCVSTSVRKYNNSGYGGFRLYDGTNVLESTAVFHGSPASFQLWMPMRVCGVVTGAAGVAQTIKIQGYTADTYLNIAGSGAPVDAITWTVKEL